MTNMQNMNDIDTKRDKDGFIHLQWKVKKPGSTKNKKSKKTKKIKFKKGSWKDSLYKMISKLRKPKNVDKFHDKTRQNIIVHKNKVERSSILTNTKKNDMVLIDTGYNIYMSLTSSSYEKLGKVRRIAFEYTLKSMEDFDSEYFDVYVDRVVVHSINELCSNLVYFRQLADGIAELQALTCSFTRFELVIRVLVYKDNDNVETYKNINKFIETYNIGPLI